MDIRFDGEKDNYLYCMVRNLFSIILGMIVFVACQSKQQVPVNAEFQKENIIEDVSEGDTISVSATFKSKAEKIDLVVASLTPGEYYQSTELEIEDTMMNTYVWKTVLPFTVSNQTVKVYAWNKEKKTFIADGFDVQLKPSKNQEGQGIHFQIEANTLKVMQEKRAKAFAQGYISGREKKLQSATFNTHPVKIKFKGDWLDHLHGNKWSYRVDMGETERYKDMQLFAVQNPKTRLFMHEWLFHKLLEQEGVLTTKYTFDSVWVNKVFKGVYAIEENFHPQFLERRNLEGLVLTFHEDHLFEHFKLQWTSDKQFLPPIIQSAKVDVYGLKDRSDQDCLKAQDLLQSFKFGTKSMNEIFDLDQMARFYAIVNVTRSFHSFVWHNQRFYWNQKNGKIEPIAYDGATQKADVRWISSNIIGNIDLEQKIWKTNLYSYHYHLLADSEFQQLYINYLKEYTTEAFLQSFIASVQKEFDYWDDQLKNELDYVEVRTDELLTNAQAIIEELPSYEQKVSSVEYKTALQESQFYQSVGLYGHPYPKYLVNAYLNGDQVEVQNFYHTTIKTINGELVGGFDDNSTPKTYRIKKAERIDSFGFYVDSVKYMVPIQNGRAPIID